MFSHLCFPTMTHPVFTCYYLMALMLLSALLFCVSPAGQHRLLVQLRKRRPGWIPVRGLQGAAQSVIRDEQWAQWEGESEWAWAGVFFFFFFLEYPGQTSEWWPALDVLNVLHLWTCHQGAERGHGLLMRSLCEGERRRSAGFFCNTLV